MKGLVCANVDHTHFTLLQPFYILTPGGETLFKSAKADELGPLMLWYAIEYGVGEIKLRGHKEDCERVKDTIVNNTNFSKNIEVNIEEA